MKHVWGLPYRNLFEVARPHEALHRPFRDFGIATPGYMGGRVPLDFFWTAQWLPSIPIVHPDANLENCNRTYPSKMSPEVVVKMEDWYVCLPQN